MRRVGLLLGRMAAVQLSAVQSAILAGIGLQRKSIDDLEVRALRLSMCMCMGAGVC
jgi:hypothetical protein